MPVTFGSVGDILTICSLIKDLTDTLNDSTGSSSQFQAVIRDLGMLEATLKEVQELSEVCNRVRGYESLSDRAKLEALECKEPITKFRDGIEKYRASLRYGGSGSAAKDAVWKIRWAVAHKKQLEDFRQYIRDRFQVMTIVIVAAKAKADILSDQALEKALESRLNILELANAQYSFNKWNDPRIEDLRNRLERLERANGAATSNNSTVILSLQGLNLDKLRLIGTIALQTWRSVMYIRALIPKSLNPWSQKPATLEDALGRIAPIPLELIDTWRVFERVLQARFADTPGLRRIKEKGYIIQDALSKRVIVRGQCFKCSFRPGKSLVMSAFFPDLDGTKCPGCEGDSQSGLGEEVNCSCGQKYTTIVDLEIKQQPTVESIISESIELNTAPLSDNVNDYARVSVAVPKCIAEMSLPTYGGSSGGGSSVRDDPYGWTCCHCGASNGFWCDECGQCTHSRCAWCS